MKNCDWCDGPGDIKTYDNQMLMPIRGRVVGIDRCIGHIVAALNAGNVPTEASCCGHGRMFGRIDLEDGRVLVVAHRDDVDDIFDFQIRTNDDSF